MKNFSIYYFDSYLQNICPEIDIFIIIPVSSNR